MKRFIDIIAIGLYLFQRGAVMLLQGAIYASCMLLPVYLAVAIRCGFIGG